MRRIVFILLLLLLPLSLRAQQNPAPRPRPKIGVALEGGGAMGLAHIGVLKWFEEHHIPVDYVAGTSMGGLVGGFYATGMSPDELKTLIDGVDWRKILGDRTPYEDLAFRRKEDQRAYPNSLIFGLREGLSLPAGLNAGHQIGLIIDRMTLPYDQVPSFDALPIPFRCVATDLVSGKSYVFKDGSLAVALRSTMSIPGAFSPVHDGKAVFVDGGLLDNLPTDVVRQMGAEIVIAVHLERGPAEAKDIQSVFAVLNHSVSAVLQENELRGLERADAVISVPLSEFRTRDYAKSEQIIKRGYEAANARARLLEAFALDDADWQAHQQVHEARKRSDVPTPQFIEVEGTNAHEAIDVTRYVKRFQGKPVNPEKLDEVLTRLTGVGRYDSAGYRLIEKNGQMGLLIQVVEKNYAPPMFQTAFEVDGSQSGDVGYSFGRFGELRVGYQIGSLNTKLRLGTPEIPSVAGRVGQTRLHYLLDHTDDPVIPRRGFSAETNFRWFDQSPAAKGGFPSMDLKLGYFQPIAKSASLFLQSEGGTTFGNTSTGVPQFFLGGPVRLGAYGQNEFQGNQYYLLRAGFLRDLLVLPPFLGKKVYAVGAYEIGKMYGLTTGTDLPDDVAAGFLPETALGPFFIGGSVGDPGHRKWFCHLGRVF